MVPVSSEPAASQCISIYPQVTSCVPVLSTKKLHPSDEYRSPASSVHTNLPLKAEGLIEFNRQDRRLSDSITTTSIRNSRIGIGNMHAVINAAAGDYIPRNEEEGEEEADSESSPEPAKGSSSNSNVDLRHFGPGFWLTIESHHHLNSQSSHHADSIYPKERQHTHNSHQPNQDCADLQNQHQKMYPRSPYAHHTSQLISPTTTPAHSLEMTRSNHSPSSSLNMPSSSSMTLDSPPSYSSSERLAYYSTRPVSLEGQKDVDMETFRQARACGMTLDPIRVAQPLVYSSRYKSIVESDSRNPRRRNSIGSGSSSQSFEVVPSLRDGRLTPPSMYSSPGTSPTKPLFVIPKSDHLNDIQSYSRDFDAHDQSHPEAHSSSLSNHTRQSSLPSVPVLDPRREVERLRVLLRHHGYGYGFVKADHDHDAAAYFGNDAKHYPTSPEEVINLEWLIRDHDGEEVSRRQTEGLCIREEDFDIDVGMQQGGSYAPDTFSIFGDKENPRSRMLSMMVDTGESRHGVFGQPLSLTRKYASCVYPVAGYQHELPIVVFACVEELYRTGMTVPGLFRTPPDRVRHNELIDVYDTGPLYGSTRSLAKENTADICALLRSYIDRLPRAIWHESLYDALLVLCVRPSAERERKLLEESEHEAMGVESSSGNGTSRTRARGLRPTSLIVPFASASSSTASSPGSPQASYRPRSISLKNISLSSSLSGSSLKATAAAITASIGINVNLEEEEDEELEKQEILICKQLLRLLPRASLSLLVYLCGFFTQLPLSIQNQLSIEDIARLFAAPLLLGKPYSSGRRDSFVTSPTTCSGSGFGFVPVTGSVWAEKKEEAGRMLEWILRRWTQISDGLFEPDPTQGFLGQMEERQQHLRVDSFDEKQRVGGSSPSHLPVPHVLGMSMNTLVGRGGEGGRTCSDDKLDTPSATSSDTESVHSVPSSYAWSSSNPSIGLSLSPSPMSQPVNPSTLGSIRSLSPFEPLGLPSGNFQKERSEGEDLGLDLDMHGHRHGRDATIMKGKGEKEEDFVMAWKCHVDNDNNELGCTLMDVHPRMVDKSSST